MDCGACVEKSDADDCGGVDHERTYGHTYMYAHTRAQTHSTIRCLALSRTVNQTIEMWATKRTL